MTIPGLASAGTAGLDAQVSVPDAVDQTLEKGAVASPPPLDTVEDAVDSVLDPVEDATKPVKDAVTPVIDTVDETTDSVDETVDKGTAPVPDIVDDPERPGTDGTGSVTSPPPISNAQDRPQPAPGDEATGRRRSVRDTAVRVPSRGRTPDAMAVDAASRPAARAFGAEAAPDNAAASNGSVAEQIARAAVDASRAFRFPLLVAAAVLLFLAIQGQIDGRDPKLAHTNDDELMFA